MQHRKLTREPRPEVPFGYQDNTQFGSTLEGLGNFYVGLAAWGNIPNIVHSVAGHVTLCAACPQF